jgi:hypothetical protein
MVTGRDHPSLHLPWYQDPENPVGGIESSSEGFSPKTIILSRRRDFMAKLTQPFEMALSNLFGTANPTAALRGLRDIRKHVDDLLERMEADLVGRARRSGATYEEIARSLGLSDSQIHRKYGPTRPKQR